MEQYQGILEQISAQLIHRSVTGNNGTETKDLLMNLIGMAPDHTIYIMATQVKRDLIEDAGVKCSPSYRPGPPTITLTIEIKL